MLGIFLHRITKRVVRDAEAAAKREKAFVASFAAIGPYCKDCKFYHRTHEIDEEGKAHPFFEIATAEEAKSLEAALKGGA